MRRVHYGAVGDPVGDLVCAILCVITYIVCFHSLYKNIGTHTDCGVPGFKIEHTTDKNSIIDLIKN